MLGQCSSLTVLNLSCNGIRAEGAGRLAGVLGQCSSLAKLQLDGNGIDDDGIAMLRACWPGGSGLQIGFQLYQRFPPHYDEEEASDMGDDSSEESGQEGEEED